MTGRRSQTEQAHGAFVVPFHGSDTRTPKPLRCPIDNEQTREDQ